MKTFSGKFLLITLLITIGYITANAQFYYGAKAGYLSSKLYGDDTYGGINWAGNPSAGLSFGVKFNTDFNLQWDVLYSVKGTKQKFIIKDYVSGYLDDTTTTFNTITKQYDNELSLAYVELPIYFKKSFSFRGGTFPYERVISKIDIDFMFGPYVGYMIGSTANLNATKQKTSEINGNITVGETFDTISTFMMGQHASAYNIVDDGEEGIPESTILEKFVDDPRPSVTDLMKIDVGINAGIGFSFEISNSSKLYIEARSVIGLLSIDKEYFNNYTYILQNTDATEGKVVEIGDIYYSYTKTTETVELKNIGMGIYLGYIHYVGMIKQ